MEPTAKTAPPLPASLNVRLSIMMFLQYAIWGAWLPLFFPFLLNHRGLSPEQIGMLFAVGAAGALAAPFISGQIADRWFNTERFLGLSHVLGAALVWQLAGVETYTGFIVFGLCYSLIYAPTLALTNSLAFHHLPDRDRDFGRVRVWGTIGWICVGIGIGQWLLHTHTPTRESVAPEAKAAVELMKPEARTKAREDAEKRLAAMDPKDRGNRTVEQQMVDESTDKIVAKAQFAGMGDAFRLSAILGLLLGLYCLTLPRTPPSPGRQKFAPAEALAEVKKQPLLALFLISFPIACVHQFYFVHTAGFLGEKLAKHPWASSINSIFGVGGGGLMTIGQMAETLVLAFMPVLAKKLGRKTLLTIGLLAYILRYAVFAYFGSEAALVIPALALHGFVFGCFFFVCFMIVDENTSSDVRASAQGLFNLVIVGLGTIMGNLFAGKVGGMAKPTAEAKMDYKLLFSTPMWVCVACFILLLVIYPKRRPLTSADDGVQFSGR